VIEAITEIQPRAVIVDSIQTVYLAEANGSAGSVSQVGHQLLLYVSSSSTSAGSI